MAVHVVPHSLAPALRREGRRGAEGGSASGPCALLAQSEASNARVTRDIHACPQTCPRQLGPQRRPNLGGPSLPESPGQAARCGQTSDGRARQPLRPELQAPLTVPTHSPTPEGFRVPRSGQALTKFRQNVLLLLPAGEEDLGVQPPHA